MTNSTGNNLTREKIQQLLAAVGSQTDSEELQPEVAEHNWRQPHCFNNQELDNLNSYTDKTAELIAQKFNKVCHSDFKVTINSTSQCYADEFLNQIHSSEQKNYYLAFGIEPNNPCALLGMSVSTAVCWVNYLLQDTEADKNTDRVLSQLEESLLYDISSVIIEAISEAYPGLDFKPENKVENEQLPTAFESVEQLCKIDFKIELSESKNSSQAYLVIPCRLLNPVVGKTSDTNKSFSEEQVSQAMFEYIQELPVCVWAQLGSAKLTFAEAMNLNPSDILLLDTKIDEPALLFVEGIERFQCRPAKSNGFFAVVITAPLSNTKDNKKHK
jgi:flagellar motor switch protein FliM